MASSKATNINYVANYFQIKILTKIHGEPNFETLKTLRNQIKANAGSVPTHLGGGRLGYLGTLFSILEYARAAPGTPFVRPPNPGVLVIPPGTTQHAATRMREDHVEALRIYRECIDVEQTLIQQVLEAIDEKYTKCLRNRLTQCVDMTLEALFTNLFRRYGLVTAQALAAFEKEVRDYRYDIIEPLSTVYDLIDDLELMDDAAATPYTPVQLVAYGLEILRNCQEFQEGIKTWNRRAPAMRTWVHFMTHFDKEYQDLLKLRGPTMRSSNLHSANALMEQVKENVDASVDAAIKRHVANSTIVGEAKRMAIPNVGHIPPELQNLPPGFTVHEIPEGVTPHTAFAANSNQHVPKDDMATFMKVFMEKMDAQAQVLRNITNNRNGRGGGGAAGGAGGGAGGAGGSDGFDAGGGGGSRYRRRNNISKYCCTHGACAHDSRSCNNKKDGHVDTATFRNKRGGSVKFCNQSE